MDFLLNRIDVINLFAEDFAGTRSFYQEVLGLPLTFEDETTAVFKLENIMICLSQVSSGPELIPPASGANPEAEARFVLAMFVTDVDASCAELVERGVTLLSGPEDQPWGVRSAGFADPAGHIWRIAQDLD